jgi:hypothetical protein
MVVNVGEIAEQAIRSADLGAPEASIARVNAQLVENLPSAAACRVARSAGARPVDRPFNTWRDRLTGGQSATRSVALPRGLARRRGRS